MALDNFIQLPPDAPGKRLRTVTDVIGGVDVHTQIVDLRTWAGLTDTQLRATAVSVRDDFTSQIDAADQAGANAVLTFSLGSAVSLVVITSIGGVARANVSGGTPSATSGLVCVDGGPTYIPVNCAGTVKVYAPTGSVVSVSGLVH